jgi:hypothetical protein
VPFGIHRDAEGPVALTIPGQPRGCGGSTERMARAKTVVGDHRAQVVTADPDFGRARTGVRHQAAGGDRGSSGIAGDEIQLDSSNLSATLVEHLGRELTGHPHTQNQFVWGDRERVGGICRGGQLIGTTARGSKGERDGEKRDQTAEVVHML